MRVIGQSGTSYVLEQKPFSSGGEGDIYAITNRPEQVVKIYHPDRITSELENKLLLMAKNPPNSQVLSQVAWPLDVVYDATSHFCGFVMPKLSITAELSEVYVYPPQSPLTYREKLILAENICVVISAVHKAGYVFGDFNPRNIGINTTTGNVAFLDTDSYHIVLDKASGKAYRCNVCAPGYAAPELLEKCGAHIAAHPADSKQAYAKVPLDTFTKETDNFALAIHIFKLLMNGFTPFGGIKNTETASVGSPGVGDAAVRRDSYCFKPGNKPQSPAVPPISVLPKEIQDLFTRAFIDGRSDPHKRPTAIEWYSALERYEYSLKLCSKDRRHMYYNTLSSCPWCEADKRFEAAIAPMINPTPSYTPPTQQKTYKPPVTPVYTPPVIQPPQSSKQNYAPPSGGSTYTPPVVNNKKGGEHSTTWYVLAAITGLLWLVLPIAAIVEDVGTGMRILMWIIVGVTFGVPLHLGLVGYEGKWDTGCQGWFYWGAGIGTLLLLSSLNMLP